MVNSLNSGYTSVAISFTFVSDLLLSNNCLEYTQEVHKSLLSVPLANNEFTPLERLSAGLVRIRPDPKKLFSHRLRIAERDRKSKRLKSSHRCISYAVFLLKKKR